LYKIKFYKDRKGNSPIIDYLKGLRSSKNAQDRKQADKINDYIQILSLEGKAAGEPYIKHIKGELWELRPARDRILFLAWIDDSFLLLHHFIKRTAKTPQQEIEKAFKEIAEAKERDLK
jgi:phage-related protein